MFSTGINISGVLASDIFNWHAVKRTSVECGFWFFESSHINNSPFDQFFFFHSFYHVKVINVLSGLWP